MFNVDINARTDPFELFSAWMSEAKATKAIREPTAMCLATLHPDGDLSQRVVLCKDWSPDGFVFFTNYRSRKGRDIEDNPMVSACFYWDPMFRQVKITGYAEEVPRADSESYWNSRARGSQLSQYISHQSEVCASREQLEAAWTAADMRFYDKPIPCPPTWGGYIVRPKQIQFWIGRENRLHDSFSFEKAGEGWTFRRLQP